MSLLECLLVNSDSREQRWFLSQLSSCDSSLQDVPSRIPFEIEDLHRTFSVLSLLKEIDREPFKQ